MSLLSLENIEFGYTKTKVVSNFSLEVQKGDFVTLLGSSGCGKTTILRLISFFLNPDAGLIKINGIVQNGILPDKRKIGMVFQDYALFPHMTVEQNLLYGLKMKTKARGKAEKNKLSEIVLRTAKNLELENLIHRYPNELSGGQQQRVALGRALVLEPEILLMDEPLSSLDTKLRIHVREELKEIQQRLKITTVYVTHDQEEALSLSDKIAVLQNGRILQYDKPEKLYFEPKDCFTADFIVQANFINEGDFTYLVRPEWIKLSRIAYFHNSEEKNAVQNLKFGKIERQEFLGNKIRYSISVCNETITADCCSAENIYEPGEKVCIEYIRKLEIK